MLKPDFIKNLSQTVLTQLPTHLKDAETAIKAAFEAVLTQAFAKLNVVTQEEFEVQKKVLMKTRQKLEALEKKLQHLDVSQ